MEDEDIICRTESPFVVIDTFSWNALLSKMVKRREVFYNLDLLIERSFSG